MSNQKLSRPEKYRRLNTNVGVKMENVSINIEGRNINTNFGVTTLPNRKNPCLYRTRGAMVEPLAYFRNQENADKFNDLMLAILCKIENLEADKKAFNIVRHTKDMGL